MSERKTAGSKSPVWDGTCQGGSNRLQDWIKDAQMMEKIAETGTLESKKSVLLKIYGSNPVLKNNEIVSVSIPPYNTLLAARKNFFCIQKSLPKLRKGFLWRRV